MTLQGADNMPAYTSYRRNEGTGDISYRCEVAPLDADYENEDNDLKQKDDGAGGLGQWNRQLAHRMGW